MMNTPGPKNPPKSPDTRGRLHEAALYLIARDGPGASVRAIARHAGVTEGALYRHYKSRDELLGAVFSELVEPMVAEKENLVAMRAPIRDRLREWVRCTYARFDKDPDAFAYIFLTDHDFPREHARFSGRQSELARELLAQGRAEGLMRAIDPELASAIFVSLLLGVPERVRQGHMTKPASQYTDEISRAIWLALGTQETDAPKGS